MTPTELFDAVEAHPDLEGIAAYPVDAPNGPELWFEVLHVASKQMFLLKDVEIADQTWEKIEPVLSLKSSGQNLVCYSRVCGYFSRVENWNPSKLGERKDRMAGTYSL